jgi:dimethylamine/trimethylamine dehydrogenase
VLRRHLHELGVVFHTGVVITAIDHDAVRGETEFGDEWTLPCAGVVLVTQQCSDDTLYRELVADQEALAAAGIREVLLIGDAAAPRMPSEAVFDGHRVAREIELPDPVAPRTWLREAPSV